jgi:Mor family transcriptional regulator
MNPAEETEQTGRGVQILLDLAAVITAALATEGIAPERAREIGLLAADQVRQTYGGDAIYIPRGLALILDRRDLEIYGKYDGTNHFALAQEYSLTVRQIYTIVARVRAADSARRQMGLFE